MQGTRHLPVAFEVGPWAVGLLRSLGPWPRVSRGPPCLAVAPFNLGTMWWCWCYLGVGLRHICPDLCVIAQTGTSVPPVLAWQLPRRVRRRPGSVVSMLAFRHQPWAPQILAEAFSQARCLCTFAKVVQSTSIAVLTVRSFKVCFLVRRKEDPGP